jgi:GxxExxY protein
MYSQRQPLLPPEQEELITSVIACGLTVHRELGPGFKEKIYERAVCLELDSRNISFESEKAIEVQYKQWKIPGQRVDLIVGGVVWCWSRSKRSVS